MSNSLKMKMKNNTKILVRGWTMDEYKLPKNNGRRIGNGKG